MVFYTMRLFALASALAVSVGLTQAQVAVESGMTADSHCGQGYCVTALFSPTNQMINYTLVVPQGGSQIGWWAVAQGTRMVGANMAINWVNADQSVTTSHRSARGEVMPQESQVTVSSFAANSDVSRTMAGQTVWSWNMPMPAGSSNAVSHVFSTSSRSPSSSDAGATIVMHDRYETGISLDLTKAYTGGAPAGITGSSTQTTPSTSSSSSSGSSGNRELTKQNRVWIAHMVFMIVAWMLCFPIGILVARYGRTFFTWLPKHRIIQSVGFLFVFIGFFLAVGGVSLMGQSHFSNTHEKLGLALFILLFVQILLGVASHSLKKRKGKRYIGYVHIPFGLIMFGLSVWQIHEGFERWQWQPPAYASYIIYAWAALMFVLYVIGFAFLPKELKQNREHNGHVQKHEIPSDDDQRA